MTKKLHLGTAVLYSPAGHPLIRNIMDEHRRIKPDAWPVNNTVFIDYFINRVPGFRLNGRAWRNDGAKIIIHPKEFFEQPAWRRGRGVSIHHCCGSWMSGKSAGGFQVAGTAGGCAHRVKWMKRKLRTSGSLLKSAYRAAWLRSVLRLPAFAESWWRMD